MKNVGVISLGCAKNQVDTERMLGLLVSRGASIVSDPAEADILIVNTCGFIEPAKQEAIDTILEMAQYKRPAGRCETLVVTGCLSERYREELRQAMPEIDILLGVREYEKLPALLHLGDAEKAPLACGSPRILTTPFYSAYLRISDGCDNRCTYCAIPLIRGGLKSEPVDALVDEAKRLADGGVTELTVIAQDTSGYGVDTCGRPMLIPLLNELDRIDALRWIRVLYTYPDTVTPALIDCFAASRRIVPYLDMPLQHISDSVLRRMHRRGSRRHIESVLDYLRVNAPGFILRTTMMVGFPGETDADFRELLQFLKDYPFDRLGAFTFSPEEGTDAADLPDQVPEEVRQTRYDALMELQQGIAEERSRRRLGTVTDVLLEGEENGYAFGRSFAEAPDVDGRILIPATGGVVPIGEYVKVRLTGVDEYDMIGECL